MSLTPPMHCRNMYGGFKIAIGAHLGYTQLHNLGHSFLNKVHTIRHSIFYICICYISKSITKEKVNITEEENIAKEENITEEDKM